MDVSESTIISCLKGDDNAENMIESLKSYSKQIENNLLPDKANERQMIAEIVIQKLVVSSNDAYVDVALALLRYMSRDRNVVLKYMAQSSFINLIIAYAHLSSQPQKTLVENPLADTELNACRCLCNVIFLTRDATRLCSNVDFIKSIIKHLENHQTRSYHQNVLALRLVFLVSALSGDGRKKLIEECDARKIVLDFLHHILKLNQESSTTDLKPIPTLQAQDTEMCSEILKVIFNLNMDLRRSKIYCQQDLEELDSILRMCSIILQSKSADPSLTESMHCNAGNAIYSVPPSCFKMDLLIGETDKPSDTSSASTNRVKNLKPVITLVEIMRRRVLNDILSNEVLHPLFALLSQLCRLSRDIRLYLKGEVLPPRKDFQHRPEEGNELRNRLIKLFTHNNTDLKHGAADFLFVLCKEKVDRFVKYTGYGNAAGLLALRGLLAGGHGETEYSDTDSDSDTEEYKESADVINPVTGHIPAPHPNPMEGMSDEQKEYLAVQLANEISKLSTNEVIQPMCVGEDGQLIPFQQKVHQTMIAEEHSSDDDES